MKIKRIIGEKGKRITHLFNNAYADYKSARLMLLNGSLREGCTLACQALEKYIKGLNAIHGDTPAQTHKLTSNALLNPLRQKNQKYYEQLNLDFLEYLTHSYELRYLDSLPSDYNIVIPQRKVLAELDRIVGFIEDNISFHGEKTGERKRQYELDKEGQAKQLWQGNFQLLGQNQRDFVNERNDVHELRKAKTGDLIEMKYPTKDNTVFDAPFMTEALVEIEPNKSYKWKYQLDET